MISSRLTGTRDQHAELPASGSAFTKEKAGNKEVLFGVNEPLQPIDRRQMHLSPSSWFRVGLEPRRSSAPSGLWLLHHAANLSDVWYHCELWGLEWYHPAPFGQLRNERLIHPVLTLRFRFSVCKELHRCP